ncbi:dirigent protein 15 [Brachypodium distachyon]|uniref:Dirigent protein n=1 Tax=Brachypodium distachyon TaxID=15368 RepID=I1GLT5_BRADI|nr:dirigent protein 15 [Brachypodium distachyon]KQK12545.1 hypothetical protein BRADI_1g04420v3 [Brachypodium distachyon]|eukprot:XP_003559260.1 dirigent protein 15 [Brachypodium distachyon]
MRTPSLLLLLFVLFSFQRDTAATGYLSGPEKVTNLHFYMHDTVAGKDATDVPVAHGANFIPTPGTISSLFPFSSVYVFDNVLTEGWERSSRVVGNAQGMYIMSSKDGNTIDMAVDYELTEYKNSSFSVLTRNPVGDGDGRELTVVGGRGAFRMARGFIILPTERLNTTTLDAVIEYNVTLIHH